MNCCNETPMKGLTNCSRMPLGLIAAAMFFSSLAGGEPSMLWQEYIQDPDRHPNLPNGSYAGYRYGEVDIPQIDGPVFNVRDFGATGDGKTDDAPAIRAALDAVGPEGGVVYFPRGRYLINGMLFVHTDHTVLRGEDRRESELIFTEPLARTWGVRHTAIDRDLTAAQQAVVDGIRRDYGDDLVPDQRRYASGWSWSGGLIWFTPKVRNTYREDPSAPVEGYSETWLTGDVIGKLSKAAERGDRVLTLDVEPVIEPGEFIVLRFDDPGDFSLARHLAGDGPWAEAYDWEQNNPAGYPNGMRRGMIWVVEVAGVDGHDIILRQPLRFDVRPEWAPRILEIGDTIRESGIENLTLRFQRRHVWERTGHNMYPGWNGPWFNAAINCWLRGVTLINVDNGPGVSASKCVTITDFKLKADRPEMMPHHHAMTCRNRSHDCLFSDFEIFSKPLHGLNTEQLTSGNVWSRGYMAHGTFDTHRNLPFESIRTDIVINNDGRHGGTGGPPMGARIVHWNIEVTNDRDHIIGWANAMPEGAIVGLRGAPVVWDVRPEHTPVGEAIARTRIEALGQIPNPANLYEAQLRHRLAGSSD